MDMGAMNVVLGGLGDWAWDLILMQPLPTTRFLFKAKKAAMMTQPPATPTLPRLPREVVPADDRDDPEIILNTTTVWTGPSNFGDPSAFQISCCNPQ